MTDGLAERKVEVGEGAHLGLTASECLQIVVVGTPTSAFTYRDAEWMREYLRTAPDTVDWRAGYSMELKRQRLSLGGPQDELAAASRFIVRELSNQWPEMPLGAAQEAGLPSVLHVGVGCSDTYELVARCAGKRMLDLFERHPEALKHPPLTFQPGQDLDATLDAWIRTNEPKLWEFFASKKGLHWTGFQCGWATNAARFVLGRGPMQNPSILHLADDSDGPFSADQVKNMPYSEPLGDTGMVVIFEDNKRRND